jgi:hypothetical protein
MKQCGIRPPHDFERSAHELSPYVPIDMDDLFGLGIFRDFAGVPISAFLRSRGDDNITRDNMRDAFLHLVNDEFLKQWYTQNIVDDAA